MSPPAISTGAWGCDRCLRRTWLLARLASHLEHVRGRIAQVLGLPDAELIAALAGKHERAVHRELARFDADDARRRAAEAGLELICRCQSGYPQRLHELESPPAVLHVAGGLARFDDAAAREPVAIVGARRASPYGLEVARSLGRGLGAAGVTVVSGMALGIDSAAHAGALSTGSSTAAVMPGGANRAYPPAKRSLYRQIVSAGVAVSELPPGADVWRWSFPARNRIVAALSAMTIVVEADERSGALLTARFAKDLGRPVGAVPGRVTSPLAAGPNGLLATGANVVRGAQDVLDHLFGAGVRQAAPERRRELPRELDLLLAAVASGHDTAGALERAGFPAEQVLAGLASLELAGHVRREAGGRFSVVA